MKAVDYLTRRPWSQAEWDRMSQVEIYCLNEVEIRSTRCLAGDDTEARLPNVTLKAGLILPIVYLGQT